MRGSPVQINVSWAPILVPNTHGMVIKHGYESTSLNGTKPFRESFESIQFMTQLDSPEIESIQLMTQVDPRKTHPQSMNMSHIILCHVSGWINVIDNFYLNNLPDMRLD